MSIQLNRIRKLVSEIEAIQKRGQSQAPVFIENAVAPPSEGYSFHSQASQSISTIPAPSMIKPAVVKPVQPEAIEKEAAIQEAAVREMVQTTVQNAVQQTVGKSVEKAVQKAIQEVNQATAEREVAREIEREAAEKAAIEAAQQAMPAVEKGAIAIQLTGDITVKLDIDDTGESLEIRHIKKSVKKSDDGFIEIQFSDGKSVHLPLKSVA